MAKPPPKAPDPLGGHVRLYWEIMDSPAWNCLTASDQRVYNSLARQLRKTNNGDICLTLTIAKHFQIRSPTTLAKSLRALVAVGLIVVTRKGSSDRNGHRDPTLYAFTHIGVYELPKKFVAARPATNDWKQIKSLAQGHAAIKSADQNAKAEFAKKKVAHQNLIATSTEGDPVEPDIGSITDARRRRPLQKLAGSRSAERPENPIAVTTYSDSSGLESDGSTHQNVDSLCIVANPMPRSAVVQTTNQATKARRPPHQNHRLRSAKQSN